MMMFVLMALPLVAGEELKLKTTDIYVADYKATNIENDTLKNCMPYFEDNLHQLDWVSVKPQKFGLAEDQSQTIRITFDNPKMGYYEDRFQIRCDRYYNNSFLESVKIISPTKQPNYNILVRRAGEDMAYTVSPSKEFIFYEEPGKVKHVSFKIGNTGGVPLDVRFETPTRYTSNVNITPKTTEIKVNNLQTFDLSVAIPNGQTELNTKLEFHVGDFVDNFTIQGKDKAEAQGAAAAASVIGSDVEVGNFKIPTWLVAVILIGAMVYLISIETKNQTKNKKTKKVKNNGKKKKR